MAFWRIIDRTVPDVFFEAEKVHGSLAAHAPRAGCVRPAASQPSRFACLKDRLVGAQRTPRTRVPTQNVVHHSVEGAVIHRNYAGRLRVNVDFQKVEDVGNPQ